MLINNDTYQRDTLSERPIQQPLNIVKLTINERWCLIGMSDAGMQINDNIDPNWANEVCK